MRSRSREDVLLAACVVATVISGGCSNGSEAPPNTDLSRRLPSEAPGEWDVRGRDGSAEAPALDTAIDDSDAEESLREERAQFDASGGEPSERHLAVMKELASLLIRRGEYVEAELLLRDIVAIRRRASQRNGVASNANAAEREVAAAESDLAACLVNQGKHTAAEPLLRAALAARVEALGEHHPDVALTRIALARSLACCGELAAAEQLLTRAAADFESARLRSGGEAPRAGFDRVFSLDRSGGDGSRRTLDESPYRLLAAVRLALGMHTEAWAAAEKGQGRVLADLLLRTNRRALSLNEQVREGTLKRRIGDLERTLATFSGTGTEGGNVAEQRLAALREELRVAEGALSTFEKETERKYPLNRGQPYELPRIQAVLGPKNAVVGWVDGTDLCPGGSIGSWAYVIRDSGPVRWARVGSSDETRDSDRPCDLYRSLFTTPPEPGEPSTVAAGLAHEVYASRLAPIEQELSGVEDLVVIPSGAMLALPVESLIDSHGRFVGDRFRIRYCPSSTVYAWLVEEARARKPRDTLAPSAFLLGDPPFNAEQRAHMSNQPSEHKFEVARSGEPRPALWHAGPGEARRLRGGNREALQRLPRLMGARFEVLRTSRLLGDGVRMFLGPDASEQTLVTAASSIRDYDILHVATHAIVDDQNPGNCALILSQVGLPDPEVAAQLGERICDGRWTANEILQEWKLDADLVVLSGCQTGLGREIPGEGYLGLCHAFLQAGAHNLVISLWEVDDESTPKLMEFFYEVLMSAGTTQRSASRPVDLSGTKIAEALGQAKQAIREFSPDGTRRPYSHPWYWAGFILVGSSQ